MKLSFGIIKTFTTNPLPLIFNLMSINLKSTLGTGSSVAVTQCQVCNNPKLSSILFLGYLPPVNTMQPIGTQPVEQSSYPAQWLYCSKCNLVQLGAIVDPEILFPPEYAYTSSTTKVLRENFAELYKESRKLLNLQKDDLIVDIGSNDGNLLSNFQQNHKVLGITPEEIGKLAIKKGIETYIEFFDDKSVNRALKENGKATVITATNVFAHMENIHDVVKNILKLLKPNGVFISESHYLFPLIKTLQYDTVYHEHMRYYSLHSLKYLLEMHGLEVFHAKNIPSHGGSIRVYAARKGKWSVKDTVKKMLAKEKDSVTSKSNLSKFQNKVVLTKLDLYKLLSDIKRKGKRIYGLGAPSRASTLINYVGLDDGILDCVLEIKGSQKIGKYMPGTIIPVLDEDKLYKDQPEYALLLSWHIADELIPKIKQKGYKGKFIVPLPVPRIIR